MGKSIPMKALTCNVRVWVWVRVKVGVRVRGGHGRIVTLYQAEGGDAKGARAGGGDEATRTGGGALGGHEHIGCNAS